MPSCRTLDGRTPSDPIGEVGAVVGLWAGLYLPFCVGALDILAALAGVAGLAGLGRERWRPRVTRAGGCPPAASRPCLSNLPTR